MTKLLIALAVVIVVAGGAFYWLKMVKKHDLTNNTASVTTITKVGNPKGTPPASSSPNLAPASDQSLDQSFTQVQGNLNKLDTDQNTAAQDSSSQDTPGNY